MGIDKLLMEVTAEQPAGPDLEYDPDVGELFRAAKGKAEQQVGETLVPAKEPDWSDVRERAETVIARSKDVRFAILWARAATRIDGIVGFEAGLRLVRGIVERFWDQGYPPLDADDGNDPTLRLNALADLDDSQTLLRDLRQATFLKTADARLEVRDILSAVGVLPSPGGGAPDMGQIERVLRDHAEGGAAASIAAVASIQSEAQSLRAFLKEKVGEERLPSWTDFERSIAALGKAMEPITGRSEDGEGAGATSGGTASRSGGGDIRSRDDAYRALDRVCEFIERTEPAHPAPLLIRRAQRLLRKNFLEIVEDLTPDSLSSIRRLGGLSDE